MVKQIEDIYLCKSSGQVLGVLNGINEESCSLTVDIYGRYELSFDVNEYIYSGNELVKANYYDEISMLMQLFIPSIGYFIINSSPTSKADSEVKSVAATSIDSELENKNTTFKINCGTEDSLEYIVTYDESETETLLNGYTGLPYDYITIYNNYDEILEEVLQKYNAEYYGCYDDAMEHYYAYPERFDEIIELCNLIPRLQRKVVETEVTNDDGTTSTVSYIEEYIIITYDESDNTKIKQIEFATGGDLDLWFENRLFDLREFYKKHKSQLSLMDYICAETNNAWSIGHIDEQFYNKKVRFEIESESIYSFLTQELSSAIEGIFTFDIINKKINLYAVENLGEDTGINLAYDTVQNQLDVSCDENSIFTRFKVSGGEDLTIKQVNYGSDIIEDLSYFMNYRDSNGNRLFVTDELYNKYQKYLKYREDNRDSFISLSEQISTINDEIKEITYRVPNDDLKTNWSTYTTKELTNLLTTYNNMLVSLITLYKNDYGANGCNEDGSVNEEYLKDTIYWYDYCAYKEIITQIEDTIKLRNNSLTDEEEKALEDEINAYKTEWTLYGSKELTNLIESYENQQQVIIDEGSVLFYKEGDVIPEGYAVGEPIPWSNLTDNQKAEYNSQDLTNGYSNKYNQYQEIDENKKGAQAQLDILNAQLDDLNSQLKELNVEYNELKTNATLKTFSINGEKAFTDEDLKCLFNLYIDTDYSNENILKTSQDTVSATLEHSKELLEDAKEKLSIESQPQYTFSVEMDNILHIEGFEGIVEQFKLGNFIYIEYKNDVYVKMRLVSYTYNPMIVDNELSVEFSNVIKSASKRNDFTYLLDNATGSSKGSSSSSGGSGGSSSAFGDDLDVTMTNTMLAKLLNTEMFGTRVSNVILDTIDVNSLTARYATFGDLYNGTTTVNGDCVKTGVIQSNKTVLIDGIQKPYTIINLDDGSFSFAAEKMYYDPDEDKLVINGAIEGGSININNNFIVDKYGNLTSTTVNGQIDNLNKTDAKLSSSIKQTQDTITTEVSRLDNTDNELSSRISQTLTNITLEIKNNDTTAGIVISVTNEDGSTDEITGKIQMTGLVSFTNLKNEGETIINGSNITTGIIQSTTSTATGKPYTNINLDDGTFSLADGRIVYKDNILSFANDVTLTWNQITGTDNVANKSDIPSDEYITQITQNTVTTEYLNAKNITAGSVAAENITGETISGKHLNGGRINIDDRFVVNENGGAFNGNLNVNFITLTNSNTYTDFAVPFAWTALSDDSEIPNMYHLYIGDLYKTILASTESMSGTYYFGEIRLRSKVRIYDNLIAGGSIYPDTDVSYSLGTNSNSAVGQRAWTNLYIQHSPTVVSDANDKHDINPISERYEQLFHLLTPCTYMLNGGDRIHVGTIAQKVEEAMNTVGLTNEELGAFCKSKKMTSVVSENGETVCVPELDEDGNEQYSYKIRYEEFIMLNTHMLQKLYKKIDEQQEEIDNQQSEIDTLKQTVKDQQNEINELKTIVNELLERLS